MGEGFVTAAVEECRRRMGGGLWRRERDLARRRCAEKAVALLSAQAQETIGVLPLTRDNCDHAILSRKWALAHRAGSELLRCCFAHERVQEQWEPFADIRGGGEKGEGLGVEGGGTQRLLTEVQEWDEWDECLVSSSLTRSCQCPMSLFSHVSFVSLLALDTCLLSDDEEDTCMNECLFGFVSPLVFRV